IGGEGGGGRTTPAHSNKSTNTTVRSVAAVEGGVPCRSRRSGMSMRAVASHHKCRGRNRYATAEAIAIQIAANTAMTRRTAVFGLAPSYINPAIGYRMVVPGCTYVTSAGVRGVPAATFAASVAHHPSSATGNVSHSVV